MVGPSFWERLTASTEQLNDTASWLDAKATEDAQFAVIVSRIESVSKGEIAARAQAALAEGGSAATYRRVASAPKIARLFVK